MSTDVASLNFMAMSQEHKDALAVGRNEARAIKAYLRALETTNPGRSVTKETLEQRLTRINERIKASDSPLKSVDLIQTRLDIEQAISNLDDMENFTQLEAEFCAHARSYSERKGITYTAWREFGVSAATLRAAEVPETRRR